MSEEGAAAGVVRRAEPPGPVRGGEWEALATRLLSLPLCSLFHHCCENGTAEIANIYI